VPSHDPTVRAETTNEGSPLHRDHNTSSFGMGLILPDFRPNQVWAALNGTNNTDSIGGWPMLPCSHGSLELIASSNFMSLIIKSACFPSMLMLSKWSGLACLWSSWKCCVCLTRLGRWIVCLGVGGRPVVQNKNFFLGIRFMETPVPGRSKPAVWIRASIA